jgi:hypothetical protein
MTVNSAANGHDKRKRAQGWLCPRGHGRDNDDDDDDDDAAVV